MGRKQTWHCAIAAPTEMCKRCYKRYLASRRAQVAARKEKAAYRAAIRAYNTAYQRQRRERLRWEHGP